MTKWRKDAFDRKMRVCYTENVLEKAHIQEKRRVDYGEADESDN